MNNKQLPSIHPGQILMEEFLEPMGISQYRLAKEFWLNLQTRYDLEVAEDSLHKRLDEEVHTFKVQIA